MERAMDIDRERQIRERAYQIWEREGRSGDAEEQWFEAEREISSQNPPPTSSPDDLSATVPSEEMHKGKRNTRSEVASQR
jgi:hypothetical protein